MDGILLVDKPPGITSFGAVDRLKKRFRLPWIGHGGSLDPLATGLLVMLLGKATARAGLLLAGDKEYLAAARLGIATDTQDATGRVLSERDPSSVTRGALQTALDSFRGEIEQVPPMFSALKRRGERLYDLARRGIDVPRPPRRVNVREIELIAFAPPSVRFRVVCSKGTYIRTLAHDLGARLGVGGCLAELRRTACFPYRIGEALPLDELLALTSGELEARLIRK